MARFKTYMTAGYAHNLMYQKGEPKAKNKAKGFYLYREENSEIVKVLVIHSKKSNEIINLTKILNKTGQVALLKNIVWPQGSDKTIKLDPKIAQAITSNCEHTLTAADPMQREKFFISLFATLGIAIGLGDNDMHHGNLFVTNDGRLVGIDYDELFPRREKKTSQSEGDIHPLFDISVLAEIIEQLPGLPQERFWVRTDILGYFHVGADNIRPNPEFVKEIRAFFENEANAKELNRAKKKAFTLYFTRVVSVIEEMHDHPIAYRRYAIHTAKRFYDAYVRWHKKHFANQPPIDQLFMRVGKDSTVKLSHPIFALQKLDELLTGCSDEQAAILLNPIHRGLRIGSLINNIVKQLQQQSVYSTKETDNSGKTRILMASLHNLWCRNFGQHEKIVQNIRKLPPVLAKESMDKMLKVLNEMFVSAMTLPEIEKNPLLLRVALYQLTLLEAKVRLEEDLPRDPLPKIPIKSYLDENLEMLGWLKIVSKASHAIGENSKDFSVRVGYSFMGLLLDSVGREGRASLSRLLGYLKLLMPLSLKKIQSHFYGNIVSLTKRVKEEQQAKRSYFKKSSYKNRKLLEKQLDTVTKLVIMVPSEANTKTKIAEGSPQNKQKATPATQLSIMRNAFHLLAAKRSETKLSTNEQENYAQLKKDIAKLEKSLGKKNLSVRSSSRASSSSNANQQENPEVKYHQPQLFLQKIIFYNILSRLPANYRTHFENLVTKNNNSKDWLAQLEAMAADKPTAVKVTRVSREKLGKHQEFYLKKELIQICFNANGSIKPGNYHTVRNVHHLVEKGTTSPPRFDVFLKDAPESFTNETAWQSLLATLTGEWGYKREVIKLNFKDKPTHVALLSETVPGKTLHETLRGLKDEATLKNFYQSLDSKYLFHSIIAGMLVPLEDAKWNNYIVMRTKEGKTRIVAIDTEHLCPDATVIGASGEERTRQLHAQKETVIAKNSLFCLAGPMNQVIPKHLMQSFLKRDPLDLLETWALHLNITHKRYENFLTTEEKEAYFNMLQKNLGEKKPNRRQTDKFNDYGNRLDGVLPEGLFKGLFGRLMRMHRYFHLALKNNEPLTYLGLLSHLDRVLAQHYKQALALPPKAAFNWIANGFYTPRNNQAKSVHLKQRVRLVTASTSKQPSATPGRNSSKLTQDAYTKQRFEYSAKPQKPREIITALKQIKNQRQSLTKLGLDNLVAGLAREINLNQIPEAIQRLVDKPDYTDYYIECLLGKINWKKALAAPQQNFCELLELQFKNNNLNLLTKRKEMLNIVQELADSYNDSQVFRKAFIQRLIDTEERSTDLVSSEKKRDLLEKIIDISLVNGLFEPQQKLWKLCLNPIKKLTNKIHLEKLDLTDCKYLTSELQLTSLLKHISGLRYLNISGTLLTRVPTNLANVAPELRILEAKRTAVLGEF